MACYNHFGNGGHAYCVAAHAVEHAVFTDTDTGDEVSLTIRQKKLSNGQPFYLGTDEISEMFLGLDGILEAYFGDVLVFSSGPFQGLKIIPSSISFTDASLTASVKVKSSEAWTMTIPSWISASVLTGDTGETIVALTATAQTATTTDTISVTTANYSGSVTASFSVYEQVSYIYATDHSNYVQTDHIDTGIEHTASTMTVEIEYYGLGDNSDRMVGYQDGDTGCSSDDNDFRVFGYMNGTFDYMNYRSGFGSSYNSGYHHCTIGDCFCYDNELEAYKCQGTTVGSVPSPNCHILVDVSLIKVKSVKIKDGNTVLFDGVAAKLGNDIGIFDRVSNTLIYNSNVPMSYDA